jgi:hypothetical protein
MVDRRGSGGEKAKVAEEQRRTRRVYDEAFKRDAVPLLLNRFTRGDRTSSCNCGSRSDPMPASVHGQMHPSPQSRAATIEALASLLRDGTIT